MGFLIDIISPCQSGPGINKKVLHSKYPELELHKQM